MANFLIKKCARAIPLAFFLLLSTYQLTFAQSITVSGKVTDEEGLGIPQANILIKGTTGGTTTDLDGNYSLSVPNANSVLVFSFVGFVPQEVTVNGRETINIVLKLDAQDLDEVVVMGYGSQIETQVTGAVQQLDAAELKDIPVAQVTQKLQGRLAGVQINQQTGKPGQGMNVRIRGAVSILAGSDPLYVVDGFPIAGDINNLNPDEIESISVLKDAASTALYGSRAANGVVLITTRKGTAGTTSINLSAYTGFQRVPQQGRPEMMNGQEFAQFKKESYEDLGQVVPDAFQNPAQYGDGYDWYDAMLQTAPIQNYSVSINSGGERSRTSAVLGVFDQEGVMINSGYTRYSLRVNTDFNVSDQVTVGFNAAPTYSVNTIPSSDGAFYTSNNNPTGPGGLLMNAMLTWPMLPYENEDGSLPLTAWIPGVSAFPTPNWYKAIQEITNETKTTRLLSNAYVQYDIAENLSVKSTFNIDLSNSSYLNFNPSTVSTSFAALPPVVATSFRRNNKYLSWLNENTITYTKQVNDHSFDVLAGFTIQKYRGEMDQMRLTDFPDDRIQTIQSAINIDRTQTFNDVQEWSLLSYLARLNYNYKGKYLLTLAIRRDGSSRFGANNRWGNFPSVSAGWIISDEEFMPAKDVISFAKIRASYGVIGNNNIGNYTQYATVSTTTNTVFGNVIVPGASVVSMSNSDLGWETTKQLDIGLDLGFLDDRITFGYDFYQKNTTNLLYNVAVPQESGFSNFNGNIGELKFWGHEFSVNSKNMVGDFTWTTNANLSINKNEVLELSDGVDRIYGASSITEVGQPIGQFWGLVHEGVYVDQEDFDNSPKATSSQVGTIKFKDVNGDGVITYGGDNDDRTVIGNPFPDFIYGITNTFSYKNFDLSIVASGSHGNEILVMTDQGTTNLDGPFNVLRNVADRWRSPSNPGSGMYGKTTEATFMGRDWLSSRFVSNGSYLTIKNITLGYNVPITSDFIRNLRLYASIQQVYTFTNYRGVNPEVSTANNGQAPNALNLGLDWGAFPVPRTYTFGVNLGL
ncbi:SusC/RagA family TonB-linked outer membrane protein [Roseivirga pacifica]|uniref:SusC/RagA family TonB-linked outer membrane protein n=1 Tax=Roseivirga pacifica TaxID=1267423 RepID=UPI00227B4561|nr:TonB-dependent receptor [Roseivirga pacifica]